mgnify:CR=1 FL=1|jgi:hypothetical protein|tara:strand:+ start:454 stop:702 length:249 start_codon:yes stop_codon:yes gene_type:complete
MNLMQGDIIDVVGELYHFSRHIVLNSFYDDEYEEKVYSTYAIYVADESDEDRLHTVWKMPLDSYVERDRDNHVIVVGRQNEK